MTLKILRADSPPALDGMDVREEGGRVPLETVDVQRRLEPEVALDPAAALIAAATKIAPRLPAPSPSA